jgi:hypothetical protein
MGENHCLSRKFLLFLIEVFPSFARIKEHRARIAEKVKYLSGDYLGPQLGLKGPPQPCKSHGTGET